MDDEVRKAFRILERAGIPTIPVDHQLILKSAIEMMMADKDLKLGYWPGKTLTTALLQFLRDGDTTKVQTSQPNLHDAFRHYVGLAKFMWQEGKDVLAGN